MSRRVQAAILITVGALLLFAFALGVNAVLRAEAISKDRAAAREAVWSGRSE